MSGDGTTTTAQEYDDDEHVGDHVNKYNDEPNHNISIYHDGFDINFNYHDHDNQDYNGSS